MIGAIVKHIKRPMWNETCWPKTSGEINHIVGLFVAQSVSMSICKCSQSTTSNDDNPLAQNLYGQQIKGMMRSSILTLVNCISVAGNSVRSS